MDPLSALSIAAAVVQFVDFGIKVVSKGNQIYRSGDGSLDENHDLEIVTNDLLVLQTKLDQTGQRTDLDGRPTEDEVILRRLSTTANELAKKLLTRLNMVKAQGRFRRWKSFRQAIKSVSSQKEIDSLARRLGLVKEELQMQILISQLTESELDGRDKVDTLATQQSCKLDLLDQSAKSLLKALQESQNTSYLDAAPQIQTPACISKSNFEDGGLKDKPRLISKTTSSFSSAQKGAHQLHSHLKHNFDKVNEEAEEAVLRSLSFSAMDSRHEAVAEAHKQTFSWIFDIQRGQDQPWDPYRPWLERGSSIYWLNGKAASGKSTLMKYLISHWHVSKSLKVWSGQQQLVCASFFFWSTGTSMQKSQAGLLRSLLFQILTQIRRTKNSSDELFQRVLPGVWEHLMRMEEKAVEMSEARGRPVGNPFSRLRDSWYAWTLSELKGAFVRLMQETSERFRFCLFVDGLDEFDGDHAEIVTLFKHVASFPHTKLCLSSRPLLIFEQEFDAFPKLRLQDLTRNDIKLYAHDKLSAHGRIIQLSLQDPVFLEQLVIEILDMSAGVFLWVTLAVRSLLKGLSNSDSIPDLQRRLRELPPELDDLYSLMLRSIQPKFYVEQASRLFQIVYQAHSPISVLTLSLADNLDTQLALKTPIGPLDAEERENRVKAMSTRLKTRCAELLELRPMSRWNYEQVVQYLHLTVKEFLEKAEVWSTLLDSTKSTDFDASLSLLRSDVLMLKSSNPGWNEPQWKIIDSAMYYALKAENSTGEAQTALLNELDRVCHTLVKFDPKSNHHERNIHWSAAMHAIDQSCHNCPESFLTFAISKGLVLYTKTKLGHRAYEVGRQTVRPLLVYAIGCVPVYEKRKMTSVNLPMLAMLLRGGLNPNEAFQGSTPWRRTLSHILSISDSNENEQVLHLEQSWLDACKLLLMHGADPNAYSKRTLTNSLDGSGGVVQPTKLSVLEIIEMAFSHLPHHLVDEVKTALAQKSASASSLRTDKFHHKRKYESDSMRDKRYKKTKTTTDPGCRPERLRTGTLEREILPFPYYPPQAFSSESLKIPEKYQNYPPEPPPSAGC
ncbi:hypothetical protein B0J14DRAFT_555059 [Halenospora varia]|nr:hypothetical protein B0J14DRAFT_555059 [Halenospora varia]